MSAAVCGTQAGPSNLSILSCSQVEGKKGGEVGKAVSGGIRDGLGEGPGQPAPEQGGCRVHWGPSDLLFADQV